CRAELPMQPPEPETRVGSGRVERTPWMPSRDGSGFGDDRPLEGGGSPGEIPCELPRLCGRGEEADEVLARAGNRVVDPWPQVHGSGPIRGGNRKCPDGRRRIRGGQERRERIGWSSGGLPVARKLGRRRARFSTEGLRQ